MSSFYHSLIQEVLGDLRNHFEDNYDQYRFGAPKRLTFRQGLRKRFRSFGSRHWLGVTEAYDLDERFTSIEPYLDQFSSFYERLEDANSKDLFVKLIAYRILGEEKVRLPLGESYWSDIEKLAQTQQGTYLDTGLSQPFAKRLPLFDLKPFSFPISLYYSIPGVYSTFVARQYEHGPTGIGASAGDHVLDIGACWGDTALYFASRVGDTGKVFAFEFIPGNLSILRRNLGLNEHLATRVDVIERPVWECSGLTLNYADYGPGSVVTFDNGGEYTGRSTTISIDDFVVSNNVEKIDFVKMDIEGAELAALRGAEQTIRRSRPKLAIATYHKPSDFRELSTFLQDLGMDYKFYLGHYTIHSEETILFAH